MNHILSYLLDLLDRVADRASPGLVSVGPVAACLLCSALGSNVAILVTLETLLYSAGSVVKGTVMCVCVSMKVRGDYSVTDVGVAEPNDD